MLSAAAQFTFYLGLDRKHVKQLPKLPKLPSWSAGSFAETLRYCIGNVL